MYKSSLNGHKAGGMLLPSIYFKKMQERLLYFYHVLLLRVYNVLHMLKLAQVFHIQWNIAGK